MNSLRQLVQGFQDEELLVTQCISPDQRQWLLSELVKRGCLDCESWSEQEAEDGSLHLSEFDQTSTYPTDELSAMVSTFIQSGAGLEIRDIFGKTPLLDNLSIRGVSGLKIIDNLLGAGAHIDTVDFNGNGVFHLTLQEYLSNQGDLEKRLELLMKHSFQSNLSKANNQGYTPSDFALASNLWPIWCRTVEQKVPLEMLLTRDAISKADYEESMSLPNRPAIRKVVQEVGSSLPRVRRHETRMQISEDPELDTCTVRQCICNATYVQFAIWKAQAGQQLPGLAGCSSCGGYVLPADMEARKQKALFFLYRPPIGQDDEL